MKLSKRAQRALDYLANRPDVAERILRAKTTDTAGNDLPIFSWRPLCAPWNPTSNCTFQRDIFFCKSDVIGVVGANGIGKSQTLAAYCAARLRGRIPVFPDLAWQVPQIGWFGCEPDELSDFFERIVAFIPENEIARILRSPGGEYLELKNGSTIEPKSYAQRREQWQGKNLDFLVLNEESYEHQWTEGVARLRGSVHRKPGEANRPQLVIAFTPVKGAVFIHDVLDLLHFDDHLNKMDGKLSLFTASMRDNKTLPAGYVERVIEACRGDEDLIKIRVDGLAVDLRGKHIFGNKGLRDAMAWQNENVSEPEYWFWFNDRGKPQAGEKNMPGTWRVWERPIPRATYAIGSDVALGGTEGDFSAAFVLNADTGSIAAVYHGRLEPGDFGQELYYAGRFFNTALVGWEMNGPGATVYDRLKQLHYPRMYQRNSFGGRMKAQIQTYGFVTDKNSKPTIIHDLRGAIQDKKIIIRHDGTMRELLNFGYIRKEESSSRDYGMAALSGHDDLVMALAITWRVAKSCPSPRMVLEQQRSRTPMEHWLEKQRNRDKGKKRIFGRPAVVS